MTNFEVNNLIANDCWWVASGSVSIDKRYQMEEVPLTFSFGGNLTCRFPYASLLADVPARLQVARPVI